MAGWWLREGMYLISPLSTMFVLWIFPFWADTVFEKMVITVDSISMIRSQYPAVEGVGDEPL